MIQSLADSSGSDDEDDHMHVLRADGTFIATVWPGATCTEREGGQISATPQLSRARHQPVTSRRAKLRHRLRQKLALRVGSR